MGLIYNRQEQKDFRKKLRNNTTVAEKLLWYKIRNKQLGYKFRRQFGFGKYVADFYCHELKVVIEIDGDTHETDKELEADFRKDEFLSKIGIKVKRYKNADIKENISGVLTDLLEYIKMIKTPSNSPL